MVIKKFGYYPRTRHGEGEPAPKVAENAIALLNKYGHTADEIAALKDADEQKIAELFTTRLTSIETDVIARRQKGIKEEARVAALKDAYHNYETRIKALATEVGIELTDDEIKALEEKGRAEGMVRILLDKKAAMADKGNTPEELKALQKNLETERAAAAAARKAAEDFKKQYEDLNASLPKIAKDAELKYFAQQSWRELALKKETLDTLSVTDKDVLLPLIQGKMAVEGHRFVAEEGTDGKLNLLVVDRDGNPIPIPNSAGNFTVPEYIDFLYKPLIKKSNAGGGGNLQIPNFEGDDKKLTPAQQKAMQAMKDQLQAN